MKQILVVCTALFTFVGLAFFPFSSVFAQVQIPGGANSNPSTNPGPSSPSDRDKPSADDGGKDTKPPEPQPREPEGKVDCTDDDKDPDEPRPEDGGPPSAPGSVDLSFSLEAYPLEYSVAAGNLRLYFEKAEENMGDPRHLEYHSIAGARISEVISTNLPSGVVRRITVVQLSGKPLSFDFASGNSLGTPTGSGARSHARAELRTEFGPTMNPETATRIRQYRSAGGFMDFSLANKNILRWEGPTGRALTFPVDTATGTASIGLEVLRESEKIRQVKSTAGLLDVVSDADNQGYRIVTYLPSEVGAKVGNIYTLIANAKPKKTVHISHPLGTNKLVATFTDHSPGSKQDRVRKLTYTYIETFDGGHEWDMMTQADGMTLTSTRRVVPDHDMAGMRRVVREVKDAVGNILTRKETVQQFESAWKGWTDIQEISTPANDETLRTVQSYRYGKNPSQNDFRKLNWMMSDNGSIHTFKYDTAGRMVERTGPWLDGTGGYVITETFSYDPLVSGELVTPGDERPRTTTVSVGTAGVAGFILSRAYFAAYSDPANGGRHTVVNEDAASLSAAYGATGNRRQTKVFYPTSSGPESGRIMETIDQVGLKFQYTYSGRPGGGILQTQTGPINSAGAAKEGITQRTIQETDQYNRILSIQKLIYNGSSYVATYKDTNNYSPQGHLTEVVRTDSQSGLQRLVATYRWFGDQLIAVTSEDGSSRETTFDGFNRETSSTTGGVPSVSSPLGNAIYPARPPISRITAGSMIADLDRADWGDRTVTTTAGAQTFTESMKVDARGRVTEETDADGYTTKTTHLRNGLEMITTRPDSGIVMTQYFLDGKMKSRTGNGIVPEYYSYVANAAGGVTTTVRTGRSDSPRYQSTTTDLLGRTVLQEIPGNGGAITVTTSYVGGSSLPAKIVSSAPNVAMKFFEYDAFATAIRQGETIRSGATALNLSSSDDRIQDVEISILNDATNLWQVRKQFTYPNEGASAATRYLLSESRSKIAGFTADETQRSYTVDSLGNWQQQVTEERVAERLRIEHVTSNAFSGESVSVYHGGLMVEQRSPTDSVSTLMSYDSLGRLISTKQPHHVHADAIVYAAGKNQVISRSDANGAVISHTYSPNGSLGAGRVASITYADGSVRRNAYDIRGNITQEWGSATAPTNYGFDSYNQLEILSTYRSAVTGDSLAFPTTIGAPDVTTWVRQEATGLLSQKKYADNQGPIYMYDIAGRLTRRTTALGKITDYTYTAWGQPDVTNYADTTPDVNLNYDRMGRKILETNGIATSSYQYSATTLRPTLETISYDLDRNGTAELVRQLDRTHDNLRRPTGFTLKDGATLENQAIYGYDSFSRLGNVSGGSLQAPSPSNTFNYSYLQNSNLISQVTGPVHTVANTWEVDRDVLDAKDNKVAAVSISKYDYSVNAVGQRTALSQTGTAFSSARGIAWGYDSYGQLTSANSNISTQDRSYLYDAIGNRKKSADTLTLPVSDNYITNELNQYAGIASINPTFDADGNATAYPLPISPNTSSSLNWDSENRLTSTIVEGVATIQQFDSMGRRISKTTGLHTTLYLYEGWNVIAEYSSSAGIPATLLKTYLWGTDLSGSMQGAGGVGGLLSITSGADTHFPTYDGNGNVSDYLTLEGAAAAHFEYDPFGNTTVNTDTSNQFSYKFSTKPQDAETGLYYYGYRYYDPVTGRWPSRDPIEEKGGINLYGMVGNNGICFVDKLGNLTFQVFGGVVVVGRGTLEISSKDLENCDKQYTFSLELEAGIGAGAGIGLVKGVSFNVGAMLFGFGNKQSLTVTKRKHGELYFHSKNQIINFSKFLSLGLVSSIDPNWGAGASIDIDMEASIQWELAATPYGATVEIVSEGNSTATGSFGINLGSVGIGQSEPKELGKKSFREVIWSVTFRIP